MVAVFTDREGFILTTMSEDVKEDTKKYYDTTQISYNLLWMNKKNLAMHYGFWGKGIKTLHEALLNQNKETAEALEIKKDDRVLDAGCGVGGSAIWVAENYGAKVTGITIVEKQIKQATKNAKKRDVDHLVDFKLMDYCNTDFPNDSFDKIYAMESMCYAKSKAVFVKEMYRILKPGGCLTISDAFLDDKTIQKSDELMLNDWMVGWAVPNVSKIENFHDDLCRAGFKGINDKNVNDQIIPSAKRINKIGRVFYPFDWTCNMLGIVSNTTFKSTIATVVQLHLFSEMIMQYHLIKARKPE
ncbi:MAG: class I SAM-dependent methyltransferase [Candidatus Saccharibacteria bacterium]|nr:class I SAM-dependent methyltransferase [Candidatus Saccharibacteria bacterium]